MTQEKNAHVEKSGENLCKDLNPEQAKVVSMGNRHALILAGAGSGKTRTLVRRAAWLIQTGRARPHAILAVTFTNKAANEMKERLKKLGVPDKGMWVGTFHGLANKWLRRHAERLGWSNAFQIIDADDQRRLIKRLVKEHAPSAESDSDTLKKLSGWIARQKESGRRPPEAKLPKDAPPWWKSIFAAYEEHCHRCSLVDFAELLLSTRDLFRKHPDVLEHYQKRFTHLLVDEFQDTNKVQYDIVSLLGSDSHHTVLVVGDDSQSIYGWRGARVSHMKRFLDEFPNAATYRLEQNYRSFPAVLEAANGLIVNNVDGMPKNLWTERNDSQKIVALEAYDEQEEAAAVADAICTWRQENKKHQWSDCAVLYRFNALSRPVEEALMERGIPFRVTGGLKFFDREEVKDAMAYARLTHWAGDDSSLERILNVPARGLGNKALESLRDRAREEGVTESEALRLLATDPSTPAAQKKKWKGLLEVMENLAKSAEDGNLETFFRHVIYDTGLRAHYAKKDAKETEGHKTENLDELIATAARFSERRNGSLESFVTHAALEAGEDPRGDRGDAVELMTIHAAKGLEFPCVFSIAWEDNILPGYRALRNMDRPGALEEERRLGYVAITRAKDKLWLTRVEERRQFGQRRNNMPSMFLKEIPEQTLERKVWHDPLRTSHSLD